MCPNRLGPRDHFVVPALQRPQVSVPPQKHRRERDPPQERTGDRTQRAPDEPPATGRGIRRPRAGRRVRGRSRAASQPAAHSQRQQQRRHGQGGGDLQRHRECQGDPSHEQGPSRTVAEENPPRAQQQRVQLQDSDLPALQCVEGRQRDRQRHRQPIEAVHARGTEARSSVTTQAVGQPPEFVRATPRGQDREQEEHEHLGLRIEVRHRAHQQREQRGIQIAPAAHVRDGVRIAPVEERLGRLRVGREVRFVAIGPIRLEDPAEPHVRPTPHQQRDDQAEIDPAVSVEVAKHGVSARSRCARQPPRLHRWRRVEDRRDRAGCRGIRPWIRRALGTRDLGGRRHASRPFAVNSRRRARKRVRVIVAPGESGYPVSGDMARPDDQRVSRKPRWTRAKPPEKTHGFGTFRWRFGKGVTRGEFEVGLFVPNGSRVSQVRPPKRSELRVRAAAPNLTPHLAAVGFRNRDVLW